MSRIQKLSLSQSEGYYKNPLGKVLTNLVDPAPLLESLSVSFNNSITVNTLCQQLFSGDAPRLRELDLRYCLLAWDAPILRGLTLFKMTFIPVAARLSMDQIIAALSNMPNLEILELCDVLPCQVSPDAIVKTCPELIVSLPHLTHLLIESDAPEADFLLNHFHHPSTTSVTLLCTIRCEPANTIGVSYVLPSIRGFCKVLGQSQPVRCLVASYSAFPKAIQLITYDVPGTALDQPENAQVDLTLKLASPTLLTCDESWLGTLQSLWKSIPLKDLESLHVSSSSVSQDWSHIFTSLAATKLKRLKVIDESGVDFLRAFSPDAPASGMGRFKKRRPLKIPSLRELAINGWDLEDEAADASCAALLKICLEDRRKRRSAIDELFLIECRHVTDDDVAVLEKTVKKIT
jgi:hypothetical protein